MKKLIEYLEDAKKNKWALSHFNFVTAEQLKGILMAAKELNSPILVGTSEGERKFFGVNQAVAMVRSWREKDGLPVYLTADHTKSFDKAKEAIDAGYEYILIDGSKLSTEENISLTKQVVDYRNEKSPDTIIEGELGYLKGESVVQETVEISEDDFTKPEEAKSFIDKTGVDNLAVVIGNIHGLTTKQEMSLDLDLLSRINEVLPDNLLVLHGASGLKDEEEKESVQRGISIVHYNTEVRVAMREALDKVLAEKPKETTPYKYLDAVMNAVTEVVKEKLELLGSRNRA